jgi:DNA modification methylase
VKIFKKLNNDNIYKLFNSSYEKVAFADKPDLFLTSPPYNIGSKSPKKITHRRFGGYDSKSWGAIENYDDSMPESDYQESQKKFLKWCGKNIKENGVIIYNHKDRHKNGRLISPESWFPKELVVYDKIIWDRRCTHNHCKNYVYQHHEYFYILIQEGQRPFFTNTESIPSIWSVPKDCNNIHNAPFPLTLIRKIIRNWCPPQGLVCDPYSGSGTTMRAAFLENRSFIGSELLEKYFDYSVSRYKENYHAKQFSHL